MHIFLCLWFYCMTFILFFVYLDLYSSKCLSIRMKMPSNGIWKTKVHKAYIKPNFKKSAIKGNRIACHQCFLHFFIIDMNKRIWQSERNYFIPQFLTRQSLGEFLFHLFRFFLLLLSFRCLPISPFNSLLPWPNLSQIFS